MLVEYECFRSCDERLNKAGVCPLDHSLPRPLEAGATGGSEWVMTIIPGEGWLSWELGKPDSRTEAIPAAGWVTLLNAPAPFSLWTTFSPLVPEPSLAWLHLLSHSVRFLNSSQRSSQRSGPVSSPGPGPLAKSLSLLAEDLRFLYSTCAPSPHTPTYQSPMPSRPGQILSSPTIILKSSQNISPASQSYLCVYLLSAPPDRGFLQEEISSSWLQPRAFALSSLLGCLEQNTSRFLLNKYRQG